MKSTKEDEKKIREAVKLVKRLVYPKIDLKIHHNAKFTTTDLLDVLVYVAFSNDFCHNGSKVFGDLNRNKKVPHGDTVMHHFNKFNSLEEIKTIFERIFDVIIGFAKKEYRILKRRKVDIAIDVHQIPYWGNKTDDYVLNVKKEKGTMHGFKFLTCAIVVAGRRFTIDAIPMHQMDRLDDLVDQILKRAKSHVHIDKVLLDRGFNTVKIINILKKNKVKFIMPLQKWDTVKAWFDKSENCKSRVIKNFQIGKQEKAFVNLILVDDKDCIKRAFITNLNIPTQLTHHLFKLYSSRWSIETGYRKKEHDFKAKTTSKNYNIRLFYFLFSVCLYNLWVLVNICVSISLYGKVLEKPILTAKRFVVILFLVYLDGDG